MFSVNTPQVLDPRTYIERHWQSVSAFFFFSNADMSVTAGTKAILYIGYWAIRR